MHSPIANRTMVALFSSLMLSLSIAVFANIGDCVEANPNVYHRKGACIKGLQPGDYYCAPDTYYAGDCNGTTVSIWFTACKAGFDDQTQNTYNAIPCVSEHAKNCWATSHTTSAAYYGNWGPCLSEEPPGGGD